MAAPLPPVPADEAERLAALVATGLLDTPTEQAFDDLVTLASEVIGTPIALITLVDAHRQWFKARHGLEVTETPRSDAFCAWTIAQPDEDLFVVTDASADERFAANILVTGEPRIRFYAGAVIRSPNGQPLGTICGIDRAPRQLDERQDAQLRLIARQVGRLVELHQVGRSLARSEAHARALANRAADIVVVLDAVGTITYVNETVEEVLGWEAAEFTGTDAFDLVHPDDLERIAGELARLVADADAEIPPIELRTKRSDGSWVDLEVLATNLLDDPDVGGIVASLRDVTYRHEAEARVQRSERQLADAQRVAAMGSWELDLATGAFQWSTGLFELCGLDPATTVATDVVWNATIRPDESAMVIDALAEAVEDATPFSFRRRLVRSDGTERVVLVQGEVDADDAGRPTCLRGTLLDIHDQVAAEDALAAERTFLATVLDTLEDGLVACDADGRLTLFNPAARDLHGLVLEPGLPPEEWMQRYHLYEADGVTPLALDDVPLMQAYTSGSVKGAEIVVANEGADQRLLSCTGSSICTSEGEQLGAVVLMRDITAERAAEHKLRLLADLDPLTGLYNRAVFSRRLDAALGAGAVVTLLFIDLDGFKAVNDEHGHNVGDRVLAAVAKRLTASVKSTDVTARIGGDEFVVLLGGVVDTDQAAAIARRVATTLGQPIEVEGRRLSVGASVGTATSSGGDVDGDALLIRADHAMYEVKRARAG